MEEEKIEIIITFISLLELARLGKISIFQNDECSEIYMKVISDLNNFDVREADGFDAEEDGTEEDEEDGTERWTSYLKIMIKK